MVLIFSSPPVVPEEPTPSAVIVKGDITVTPLVMDGYESSRESQTIVHPILGRPNPDVTIRPASLRTGTLSLVFSDESEAVTAEGLHLDGGVLTLMSGTRQSIEMQYVPAGRISRALESTTRKYWVVSVDFQEVEE